MGMAVFKQPDDRYLVWDYHAVVMYDASAKDVRKYMIDKAVAQAKKDAADMLQRADEGRPYSFDSFEDKIRIAQRDYADDEDQDPDFEKWLTRMGAALAST